MEGLIRPFPALMGRLRDLGSARAFLDGLLGRGVSWPGRSLLPSPRAAWEDQDAFAGIPEFDVDERGTAPRTCPAHPGVRNVPGGLCRVCANPCRSVPDEFLHPPSPSPAGGLGPPLPGGGGAAPEVEEVAGEEIPDLDPDLAERMRDSLRSGGRSTSERPERAAGPRNPPARQAIIDGLYQQLAA